MRPSTAKTAIICALSKPTAVWRGHRPFAEEGFGNRFKLNMETRFLFTAEPSFKRRTPTNVDARYQIDGGLGVEAATLNVGVRRIAADPTARNSQTHYEYGGFSGKLKSPLLALHNTGDAFVPIVLEEQYRQKVQAAGASHPLVQRAIRRFEHCDFTIAERNRGSQSWNADAAERRCGTLWSRVKEYIPTRSPIAKTPDLEVPGTLPRGLSPDTSHCPSTAHE